jgi:hypothetical protein
MHKNHDCVQHAGEFSSMIFHVENWAKKVRRFFLLFFHLHSSIVFRCLHLKNNKIKFSLSSEFTASGCASSEDCEEIQRELLKVFQCKVSEKSLIYCFLIVAQKPCQKKFENRFWKAIKTECIMEINYATWVLFVRGGSAVCHKNFIKIHAKNLFDI